MKQHAIFLINLLQDVNIVRPLVYMAARDLGLRTAFLVSHRFRERDSSSLWQAELNDIGEATGTPVLTFENERQAVQLLQERAGILVAASESDVPGHVVTHRVFSSAPSSFVKITLQHGFECVGFLHNHAHDLAHGRNVTFAADIVCGWCEGPKLTAMPPSQRSKLYTSGPTTVLQTRRVLAGTPRGNTGLVCENLHSVRLNVAENLKSDFIGMFNAFCAALTAEGRGVVLRPHPGGQYTLKKGVALPVNALLNNHPMYKVDLTKYAYGISAPSSVLIDMVLAGIPTAVWRDPGGAIDIRNYEGLAQVTTLNEWLEFSREAVAHPEQFIDRQQRFLEEQQMPTDAGDVYQRFAHLFQGATENAALASSKTRAIERILFIANADIPTLQLCLLKPLSSLVETGEIATELLTEIQINDEYPKRAHDPVVRKWLDRRFARFRPTLVVFCRYSGPHTEYMLDLARRDGIPAIYHIDDDLLNVPITLGAKKHKAHNNPLRLAAVRYLLDNSDLVYCSTMRLRERLETLDVKAPLVCGKISCSGEVIVPATERPARRVGYMGFDKAHDLELVLPALVAFLRRNQNVEFQLFGSFTKPAALDEFGSRISLFPPNRRYEDFLRQLASLNWDIGICPLAQAPFNMLKANNKWIEYTSVGAAVIAGRGTIYEESCADGCGILAGTTEEWLAALEKLTSDPAERFAQVQRAQHKLAGEYSTERLREQLRDVFGRAKSRTEKGALAEAQQP